MSILPQFLWGVTSIFIPKKRSLSLNSLNSLCLKKILQFEKDYSTTQLLIKTRLPKELQEQLYTFRQGPKWKFVREDAYIEYLKQKKNNPDLDQYFTDYDGRSYTLFGILGDVRGRIKEKSIAPRRGLPKDISFPIKQELKKW
jgi:hypothetical protein